MARTNNLSNFLTDVAGAIKEKKGDNTNIPAANFDTEILALPSQGTYQNKQVNITTNGNYDVTPDEGYDAMEKVRLNIDIPSGSGDIKLFETEQEMQADENPSEGDLAVVYRNEVQPCVATSHFSKAIFPETVILDSALEDYVDLRFRAVDDSSWFDCWGYLAQSMFEMSCYGEQGEYRIRYESQDGITYTRTRLQDPNGDVTGNELDFGVEIYYEYEEYWNDVIGEFIQVGGNTFEGLYQYATKKDTDIFQCINRSAIDFTITSSGFTNATYDDTLNSVLWSKSQMINILNSITGIDEYEYPMIFMKSDNNLYALLVKDSWLSANNIGDMYDENKNLLGLATIASLTTSSAPLYRLDFINNQAIFVDNIDTQVSLNNYYKYWPISNMLTYAMRLSLEEEKFYFADGDYSFLSVCDSATYNKATYLGFTIDIVPILSKYRYASTQLTLSSSNQLLPDKIAYGKNGIITGDSSIWNDIPTPTKVQILNLPKTADNGSIVYNGTYNTDDLYLTRPSVYNNCKLQYAKQTTENAEFFGLRFTGEIHPRTRILYDTNKTVYMNNGNIYDCETDELLVDTDMLYLGPKNTQGTVFYGYTKTNSNKTITIYKVDLDDYNTKTTIGTFTFNVVPSYINVRSSAIVGTICPMYTFHLYRNDWGGSNYTSNCLSYAFDTINERLVLLEQLTNYTSSAGSSSDEAARIISGEGISVIYGSSKKNNTYGLRVYSYNYNTQTLTVLYSGPSQTTSDYDNYVNVTDRPAIKIGDYLYSIFTSGKNTVNIIDGKTSSTTVSVYVDDVLTNFRLSSLDAMYDKHKNIYIYTSSVNGFAYSRLTSNSKSATGLNVYFTGAIKRMNQAMNANLYNKDIQPLLSEVVDYTNDIITTDGLKEGVWIYTGLTHTSNENYDVCYCNATYYKTGKNNFMWCPSLISSNLPITIIN